MKIQNGGKNQYGGFFLNQVIFVLYFLTKNTTFVSLFLILKFKEGGKIKITIFF
jgi:hypothetical protein